MARGFPASSFLGPSVGGRDGLTKLQDEAGTLRPF
jgi:hypothetical protein